MSFVHQTILYSLLVFLGASLLLPGLSGIFKRSIGSTSLVAEDVDAHNHLRALNGMMAALGMIALWACWDLQSARSLVQALGVLMVVLVPARIYSMAVDGMPGMTTRLYLGAEAVLGTVFLNLATRNKAVRRGPPGRWRSPAEDYTGPASLRDPPPDMAPHTLMDVIENQLGEDLDAND